MKKKLLMSQTSSEFKRLDVNALAAVYGGSAGNSCGQTSSSSRCDKLAICNCPVVPDPPKDPKPDDTIIIAPPKP